MACPVPGVGTSMRVAWPLPSDSIQLITGTSSIPLFTQSQTGAHRATANERPCCLSQPLGLGPWLFHTSEDGDTHGPGELPSSARLAFTGQGVGGSGVLRGSFPLGEPGLTAPGEDRKWVSTCPPVFPHRRSCVYCIYTVCVCEFVCCVRVCVYVMCVCVCVCMGRCV